MSRKFCQKKSNFDGFFVCFVVDERREDPNTHYKRVIIGPPPKRQLAFRWRADRGPTLNAGLLFFCSFVVVWGIRSSIARDPIFL